MAAPGLLRRATEAWSECVRRRQPHPPTNLSSTSFSACLATILAFGGIPGVVSTTTHTTYTAATRFWLRVATSCGCLRLLRDATRDWGVSAQQMVKRYSNEMTMMMLRIG